MNTPLFTGEYRRKPVQSLGGTSKSDTKDDLLEKNRRQRMLREHRRQEDEAATRIQAFYRGTHSRRVTQSLTRQRFDELAATAQGGPAATCSREHFLMMAKCLNNFYLSHLDGERIIFLSSLYLKNHREILALTAPLDAFALGKFFANLLGHLAHLDRQSCEQTRQYAGPLRAIELALQPGGDSPQIPGLSQYLAGKGYFRHLVTFTAVRCGLANRTDLSDAISQPLVQSLCQLVVLPLSQTADAAALEELCGHLLRQTLGCSAAQMSPRLACHLVGPVVAAAVRSSSAPRQLSSALLKVASAAAGGPGMLHLLACRGRDLLAASCGTGAAADGGGGTVSDLRRFLAAVHACCRSAGELPPDLAEEATAGLADEWFAELVRLAMSGDPPAECFVHLSGVCNLVPSLSLYSLTPAGPPRAAFLLSFWRAVSKFRWSQSQQSQTQQSLVQQISRAVPPEPHGLAALQPLLMAFTRLFSPDPLPRQSLLLLSGELRDLLLGLLLLSHPDTRPDLLNADYMRALKSLGGASAEGAGEEGGGGSRELLELYSGLFSSVKLLVSRLYNLDLLRRFTSTSAGDDASSSAHWSVQGRVPPIKSLQPSYWLERGAVDPSSSFGYYSVLNDAISIPYLSSTERLQLAILTEAPYLISFWDRVRLLYSLLHAYKANINYDRHEFGASGIRVTARRDRIYEDAFSQLYGEENLYPRLKVAFRNELGLEEAGIDGGGLMREFLALVLSAAFDPQRGFYSQTSSGALYPNPLSPAINPEYAAHYFFHGKLLGKLLFERLLIDLPLAPFFLRRVILFASGARDLRQRAVASLDELVELDAELYKNVSALSQATPEELEAMELDFSISEDRLGKSETAQLKPDGASIRVTPDNASEYQQLLADYKLRRQIQPQTQAFAQGLVSVIPCPDWLAFFSHKELQLLISGSDSPIDVLDLRKHAAYQGCSAESDTVAAFWRLMLDDFSELQRRAVLRFVTSLTRAPLYGWRELQPPFTVALVPETDRLPSASTCINLLKLPDYRDTEVLRQKLLMAVESNCGFELS